jgi:hypothetical protein
MVVLPALPGLNDDRIFTRDERRRIRRRFRYLFRGLTFPLALCVRDEIHALDFLGWRDEFADTFSFFF